MVRTASPITRALLGVVAGAAVSLVVVVIVGAFHRAPPVPRLVPEDASGHLRRIAIRYVPAMDGHALPVWHALFRVLSDDVEVAVERARLRALHRTDAR